MSLSILSDNLQVPNETFKAAAHLVVTGYKRKYPNVKIILAHLGGSMPYLAARVAALSPYMGCPLTSDEILEDFKSFYYDTALSASDVNLKAIEAFAGMERVFYGSDFPGTPLRKALILPAQFEIQRFQPTPFSGTMITLMPSSGGTRERKAKS